MRNGFIPRGVDFLMHDEVDEKSGCGTHILHCRTKRRLILANPFLLLGLHAFSPSYFLLWLFLIWLLDSFDNVDPAGTGRLGIWSFTVLLVVFLF